MPKFCTKICPGVPKKGAGSILADSSSCTSKPHTKFSSKSNEFDIIAYKTPIPIIVRAFWKIFDYFKIFVKMLYPKVKFYEKHDTDIGMPLRPTVLELPPSFVQK